MLMSNVCCGVIPLAVVFILEVLGWPKSSFGCFCSILPEDPNDLFGQHKRRADKGKGKVWDALWVSGWSNWIR